MRDGARVGHLGRIIEHRWALVPVGLLAMAVAAAVLVVTFVVGERGATAAEPDYYRKGAAWDDWKRQVAENGVLRWTVTPDVVAAHGGNGLARLELHVVDKHSIPLEGAVVRAEVIPIGDADGRAALLLAESAPGTYGADLPVRVGGLWEIRSTVEWKGQRYCDRVRRNVSFGAARVLPAGAAKGGPG